MRRGCVDAAAKHLEGVRNPLATAAGLTGWPTGESERAARACFESWLAARGGIGNGEVVESWQGLFPHLQKQIVFKPRDILGVVPSVDINHFRPRF